MGMGKLEKLLLVSATVVLAGLGAGCSGPAPSTPPPASPQPGTVSCVYNPSGVAAKPAVVPSGENILDHGTVTVTMRMDAGDVTLSLDRASAPCAVNSFEALARQGYFDDTSCHRLVPGFVFQCGDPSGTSSGGPGYRFADELTGDETYPYGTVAMANAGPDTNGSQFFIVIGADGAGLPPKYDVLGQVDPSSMAVIESIAAQGVDPSDPQGIRPLGGGHIQSVDAD